MNEVILETKKISKDFGDFRALDEVSITVQNGTLHCIIGPNGAGKTTFFNIITGKLRPDEGKILFCGRDITGSSPDQIVYLGMARSFQIVSLFPSLSVFENLMVAVIMRYKKGLSFFSPAKGQHDIEEEVWQLLASIGVEKQAKSLVGMLSHGDKRRLDIGVALASQPKLLLLDEPTSGLNPEEATAIVELIKYLHEEKNVTILFIEHNMKIVFAIAEKMTVLHHGNIIAEGRPEEVKTNKTVIEAYLGEGV
jgi:branched-chain amino acid transport system ATP-binding protein